MKKITVHCQLLLLLFSLLYYDVSNAMKRSGSPLIEQQPLLKKSKRDYLCTYDDCNKSFNSPSSLETHIRMHTGERPFECSICYYAFSQSAHLTRHIKRKHSSEKPYKCTWSTCTKAFSQNHDLTRHMKIHTSEKPFKCTRENCGKAFLRKYLLTDHEKKHTKKNTHRYPLPRKRSLVKVCSFKEYVTQHQKQENSNNIHEIEHLFHTEEIPDLSILFAPTNEDFE